MDPNCFAGLLQPTRVEGYLAGAATLVSAVSEALRAHPWMSIALIVLIALVTSDRQSTRRRKRKQSSRCS